MNLNHSRIILITHRKFHQNQSNFLGGVHTHTDGHQIYMYIFISLFIYFEENRTSQARLLEASNLLNEHLIINPEIFSIFEKVKFNKN